MKIHFLSGHPKPVNRYLSFTEMCFYNWFVKMGNMTYLFIYMILTPCFPFHPFFKKKKKMMITISVCHVIKLLFRNCITIQF